MNGRIQIGLLAVAMLAALALFDSYGNSASGSITGAAVAENALSISVGTGWNAISAGMLRGIVSTTCSPEQIRHLAYNPYNPAQGDSGIYALDESLKLTDARIGDAKGVWLLNSGEPCMITAAVKSPDVIQISSGWNLISIQPSWEGKKVQDVFSACKLQLAYLFDPSAGWGFAQAFSQADVGKGLFINVNEQCELSLQCTDSDGGNNILVKGTASNSKESRTDSCSTYNTVIEQTCTSEGNVLGTAENCPTGYTCKRDNGACVDKATAVTPIYIKEVISVTSTLKTTSSRALNLMPRYGMGRGEYGTPTGMLFGDGTYQKEANVLPVTAMPLGITLSGETGPQTINLTTDEGVFTVKLPANSRTHSYYVGSDSLIYHIDKAHKDDGAPDMSAEEAVKPEHLVEEKPDLVIESVYFSKNGRKLVAVVAVKNAGNSEVEEDFSVSIKTDNHVIGDGFVSGGMKAAGSVEVRVPLSEEVEVLQNVLVKVDANNRIDETNENNNELTTSVEPCKASTQQDINQDMKVDYSDYAVCLGCTSKYEGYFKYYDSIDHATEIECRKCDFNGDCEVNPDDSVLLGKKIPPKITSYEISPQISEIGTVITINAFTASLNHPSITADIKFKNSLVASLALYDDGQHGDNSFADSWHGNVWNSAGMEAGEYKVVLRVKNSAGNMAEETAAFSLSIDACKEAITGHNLLHIRESRANVVFVGANYDNLGEFKEDVLSSIDSEGSLGGILSQEPFKSNRDKFNFWYVDGIGRVSEPPCGIDSKSSMNCVDRAIDLSSPCAFSNKYVIALFNYPLRGFAIYRTVSAVGTTYDSDENFPATVTHEFGHLFAKLGDEYVESATVKSFQGNYRDNLFVGDAKKCQNIAPWHSAIGNGCGENNVIDCVDSYNPGDSIKCKTSSYDCYIEVGCFEGIFYYLNGGFRSVYNSVMRSPWFAVRYNTPRAFGLVNERIICDEIKEVTGNAGGPCNSIKPLQKFPNIRLRDFVLQLSSFGEEAGEVSYFVPIENSGYTDLIGPFSWQLSVKQDARSFKIADGTISKLRVEDQGVAISGKLNIKDIIKTFGLNAEGKIELVISLNMNLPMVDEQDKSDNQMSQVVRGVTAK